jgi:hypothetical protein
MGMIRVAVAMIERNPAGARPMKVTDILALGGVAIAIIATVGAVVLIALDRREDLTALVVFVGALYAALSGANYKLIADRTAEQNKAVIEKVEDVKKEIANGHSRQQIPRP